MSKEKEELFEKALKSLCANVHAIALVFYDKPFISGHERDMLTTAIETTDKLNQELKESK